MILKFPGCLRGFIGDSEAYPISEPLVQQNAEFLMDKCYEVGRLHRTEKRRVPQRDGVPKPQNNQGH